MMKKTFITISILIGMLMLGTASAAESVAFKDLTLFKFMDQGDNWKRKITGNGQVEYKCKDMNCEIVVDAIGIGSSGQNIVYACDEGAVVILLSSGILLVPEECEGALE